MLKTHVRETKLLDLSQNKNGVELVIRIFNDKTCNSITLQ